jgi:hypothetical protein
MPPESEWVCRCRRCNGVHTTSDVVQYVWEFALGSCDVPVVVAVDVGSDGVVLCAFVLWHGEPNEPQSVYGIDRYIVSCRPREGTVPTEGDIARWTQWARRPNHPIDWLIVDKTRFRSVANTADALRERRSTPAEQSIPGDWDGSPPDRSWRAQIRDEWTDTVRTNRRESNW